VYRECNQRQHDTYNKLPFKRHVARQCSIKIELFFGFPAKQSRRSKDFCLELSREPKRDSY